MIPIFSPYFSGNEKKYLMDCIDSSWISSQGDYIIKFEKALAQYHNMKFAIATSNCTTALHLSLKSLDIGPGDEVICPALTFISPANMIVLSGAELVLVDINAKTLTIDPKLIEKKITHKTKAIIVVHQFGHASHMDEIILIAKKHKLKIIEDNAESIGGLYKGGLLGTFGDISAYSFFGNKIITTGEGGALLTNNKDIDIKCRELRDHGMNINKKYHHTDLGYNYRMTNMQAAIGLAQLEELDNILAVRKSQMEYYYERLSNIDGIKLREFSDWCEPVHWMMTLALEDKYNRRDFINYMSKNKIECRKMINPVHMADHFTDNFVDNFDISNRISKKSVHLPSGSTLTEKDIDFVCENIGSFVNQN
tara:strand:- start:39368 stop:40465 length:1098 start_codon:yes stop_codon:yes gene_type:complete